MPLIKISSGKSVLVSEEDFEELNKHRWSLTRNPDGRPGKDSVVKLYACRFVRRKGRTRKVYMHRVIMGNPRKRVVDHINGNGLDNRRENLRICAQAENIRWAND